MLNPLELTGRAETHIQEFALPDVQTVRTIHAQSEAGNAFIAMREAAMQDGINMHAVSVFRHFAGQLSIWNRKYRGERPLYDRHGQLLDYTQLSEDERIDCILAWSALPGASRHHWGTEFDVIDRAAMPEGYQVKLLPAEYAADGVFSRLATWLVQNAADYGFFWPYDQDRGGLNPEPWHLSYAPVSAGLIPLLSVEVIREAILQTGVEEPLLGRERVLEKLDDIHQKQVCLVGTPTQQAIEAHEFKKHILKNDESRTKFRTKPNP